MSAAVWSALIAAGLLSFINLFTYWKRENAPDGIWSHLIPFTKPAPLVVLVLLCLFTDTQDNHLWLTLGLFFSLIGDIFLLLSGRFFPLGMLAFMLTHLCYIKVLFSLPAGATSPLFSAPGLFLLACACFLIYFMGSRISPHLPGANRKSGRLPLRPLAMLYIAVICFMVLSAQLTLLRPDWAKNSASLVSVGALLFCASDSLLAYNRFIRPVRRGRPVVIILYHLAQIAMTAGILIHFNSF